MPTKPLIKKDDLVYLIKDCVGLSATRIYLLDGLDAETREKVDAYNKARAELLLHLGLTEADV